MNDMAKIFWTGRSQAVRLPKAYRFDATEVRIRRDGDKVVLEPVRGDDDTWVRRISASWDADAAAAALDRPGPEALPDGPHFD